MKQLTRRLALVLGTMAGVAGIALSPPAASAATTDSSVDFDISLPYDQRSSGWGESSLHLVLRAADGSTVEVTGDTYLRLVATKSTRTSTTYEASVTSPVGTSSGGTGDADLYVNLRVAQETGDGDLYVKVTVRADGSTTTFTGSTDIHFVDGPDARSGSNRAWVIDTGIA